MNTDHLLICGDNLVELRKLPDKCVDLCFTSPPYEAARTYGIDFNLRGAPSHRRADGTRANGSKTSTQRANGVRHPQVYKPPALANPGNLIHCGPGGGGHLGDELAHENEAPFPEALAEFFILSFCPPGGTVLDPHLGSGTTSAVAAKHGRKSIGIDIRQSQIGLSRRRLVAVKPLFVPLSHEMKR